MAQYRAPHSSATSKAKRDFQSNFDSIRETHQRKGTLFEDEEFPAKMSSVYKDYKAHGKIQWMRPPEIVEQPDFFVDGIDRFDVRQGKLGNCWMVAALACLPGPDHRDLFKRVVPPGQSFDPKWYGGIFKFNFWRFGKWEEVIVDDRLPTRDRSLVFISSSQENEFWAALVEKAYAKWNGYYMALEGGLMSDAFTDLTGGVNETHLLCESDVTGSTSLINLLSKALKRKSLVGCAIRDDGSPQSRRDDGLEAKHAYSLTDLETVTLKTGGKVTLVRVRNPWGKGREWKRDWADSSPLWNTVSKEEKTKLNLKEKNDGEFWMTVKDFLERFYKVDICNVAPDRPEGLACRWHLKEFWGRWKKDFSAGGRPEKKFHLSNPCYRLKLTDPDDDDSSRCSFLVQLIQSGLLEDGTRKKAVEKIGFTIYNISWQLEADSGQHINLRQVAKRFSLPQGDYYVVPSTYHARTEADFYIRFFFEEGNTAIPEREGR